MLRSQITYEMCIEELMRIPIIKICANIFLNGIVIRINLFKIELNFEIIIIIINILLFRNIRPGWVAKNIFCSTIECWQLKSNEIQWDSKIYREYGNFNYFIVLNNRNRPISVFFAILLNIMMTFVM